MTRARWLLAGYLALVVALLAWPNGWAINRISVWVYVQLLPYVQRGVLPEHYAALLNVLAFTVLVGLLAAAVPRLHPLAAAALATGLSVLAEAGQWLLLSGQREAGLADVVANTSGALIGALIVMWWRARRGW